MSCAVARLRLWCCAIVLWMQLVAVCGEIHCFCTMAACVSTGYMCKSTKGLCFSDYFGHPPGDPAQSRYGCLDLLSSASSSSCQGDSTGKRMQSTSSIFLRTQQQQKEATVARRICCQEDMCNFHQDYAHLWRVNRTGAGGQAFGRVLPSDYIIESDESAQERLIWFRAAVIAVPIAGGCILVLLVLLAARVLRRDARQFPRVPQPVFVETVRGDPHATGHHISTRCVYHDGCAKTVNPLWCPSWWTRWQADPKGVALV
ncbi:BMP and activin membrane-bound inhibitor homolog [Ornithodoros turicata]|uniref:BMP and activin membrane-bound inhibitor homolog n=1 Tax=Ornithodoros turicata TaxID=34597 RepID=UPI0031396F22